MEIRSIAKSVRISPRKIRLVADAIRHMSIYDAQNALLLSEKRAATPLAKALKSAVANAVNNANLEISTLVIDTINITDGSPLKRFRPSTRGRVHRYKRRSSNIRIVLKQKAVVNQKPLKTEGKLEKVKEMKKDKKGDK